MVAGHSSAVALRTFRFYGFLPIPHPSGLQGCKTWTELFTHPVIKELCKGAK